MGFPYVLVPDMAHPQVDGVESKEELMKTFDANGDGVLTKEEHLGSRAQGDVGCFYLFLFVFVCFVFFVLFVLFVGCLDGFVWLWFCCSFFFVGLFKVM